MLSFLNAFDRISNLGLNSYIDEYKYHPDIEYLLKRNKVNMEFTTIKEGNTLGCNDNPSIINRSLWPIIFERAYTNSHEIYDSYSNTTQEEKNDKKCATGLFELIRHGPLFAVDYPRRCHSDSNQTKTTTITTTTDCGMGNNNTTLKRKRSTYSS